MSKTADLIDFIFYSAELELEALPDFAISFPDAGTKAGLAFWESLAAQCETLADQYPFSLDQIAAEYNRIYLLWNHRRDNL